MGQPQPTDMPLKPEHDTPRNRVQEDWLSEEQKLGQGEETGTASGFGQTDGENGSNRG